MKEMPKVDMSAADTAAELEKLRKEVADLKAQKTAQPVVFTATTEIDIGENDRGVREFWYEIDLAPSGGHEIKLNGKAYYHGQRYKVTLDELCTLKDIVHRTWTHEASITGSNENFYRRPTERQLSMGRR